MSATEIESIREARNTPCVGQCNTYYATVCHACGRTISEKEKWVALSENEKDGIWKRIIQQGWRPRVGITEVKKR